MYASPVFYDVVIVGAGPSGRALALSLDRAQVKVALIEKGEDPLNLDLSQKNEAAFSPRWFSLAQDILFWLRDLGIDWHGTDGKKTSEEDEKRPKEGLKKAKEDQRENNQSTSSPLAPTVQKEGVFKESCQAKRGVSKGDEQKKEGKPNALGRDQETEQGSLEGILNRRGQGDPLFDSNMSKSLGACLTPIRHILLSRSCTSGTVMPQVDFLAEKEGYPFFCATLASHHFLDQLHKATEKIHCFYKTVIEEAHQREEGWSLSLSSGKKLRTPLLVGADGRDSWMRKHFFPKPLAWPFGQNALIFTYQDHLLRDLAWEHFFPGGSLALLPIHPSPWGAGVWIGNREVPSEPALGQEIEKYITTCFPKAQVLGFKKIYPGWQTPLQGHHCLSYITHRGVLLSDAAQTIHPIAGQGINLGLRMAKTIANYVVEKKEGGMDWGCELGALDAGLKKMGMLMQVVTAGMVGAFSLIPSSWPWHLSCGGIRHMPWLRKRMLDHASGLPGHQEL